jgi:hypothetical protein
MADLGELLARVEAATDFDRTLDRDIGLAIGGWKMVEVATPNPTWMLDIDGDLYPDHPGSMYPALTESVDEALALVERLLPGAMRRVYDDPDGYGASADLVLDNGHVSAKNCVTWPLAILTATLRALAQQKQGERK